MNNKFAIAPCSWGIEDAFNPDNPSWVRVIDDAGKSGFPGIELGPYGYLPTEPEILSQELGARSLQVVAGTIYDDLTDFVNRKVLIKKTNDICSLISSVSKSKASQYLVIIDAVKQLRNNTAGRSEIAVRLELDKWNIMMDNIKEISKIAFEKYGVKPVVHPHAGGFIEFKDEIERYLNDVSQDVSGLCLDTGHLYYSGEDPAKSLIEFSERLDYVHFKDINQGIFDIAIKKQMGFFEACNLGVMCSIGQGCIDYTAIFNSLQTLNYKGWITIEQERDPKQFPGALADIMLSNAFLKKITKEFDK